MANENDLTGKVGLDTTGFKAGVNDLNSQIRSIETGFRASAAVMGEWSSKSEGLTARTDSLSQKLELQRQKLSTLHSEYQKVVTEQGASSKAAESLANQMYSAEKAISSTESDIKKYNSQLKEMQSDESKATTETKQLDNALDSAGKSSVTAGARIKSSMSSLGSGLATGARTAGAAIAGMAVITVAAVAGFARLAMSAAESADAIQTTAEVYSMSAERVQELTYVGAKLDVELDTMTKAQTKLTKAMDSARDGTGSAVDAFKQLGISVTGSNGELRNSGEVFNEAITALGKMENGTERDALALKLFGKSAMDLNPLIKAGGDQIAALTEEAIKSGAVMSNEVVEGLDSFGDSVEALKLSVKGMIGVLSALALPALNQFKDLVGNVVGALNNALKTGDFSQLGTVLSDGITSAVEKLSSAIPKIVPIVTNILNSLIGAIVQAIPTILPALTAGVVQIFNALVTILQTNGPALITAGVRAIVTLVSGFAQALPQIMTAAVSLITTLASSLSQQLPTLIPIAIAAILTVVSGLVNNIQPLVEAAIQIVLALVDGLVKALPQLLEQAPQIIMTIITGIVNALPTLIAAVPQIIVSIIMGIINALPQLILAAPKIIMALITGLIRAIPQLLLLGPQIITGVWNGLKSQDWGAIGTNIVKGIWQGIKNMASWFTTSIKSFFTNIVDGVKKVLGINSPSTVFADIGNNMALGLGGGFVDTMGNVKKNIANEVSKIKSAATVSGSVSIDSKTNNNNGMSDYGGGFGINETTFILDGKTLAKSTSRVQYSKNVTRSRSLGVVLA